MRILTLASISLLAALCLAQDGSDPWAGTELIQPAALAAEVAGTKAPVVICVAFPVLYRARHIVRAIDAGPGSKPEGIAALRKAVATLPKDADLVIYCGCCPMVKCPNIRPAYRTLHEMGFTHVRVLNVPENMHTDWYAKNYPSEPGVAVK